MLLVSPFASNKIAGHPERPQGGETRLLSPLAPGPQQLCSVSAAQSQAVTSPCIQLTGPNLASIFTLCSVPCLPPTIFGVLAPRVLGNWSACHKALLCNQVTCPSPEECLGKLSHISLGCIQEKQEFLEDVFLSPFFNTIQVWCFLQTGKYVFPSNLSLTQISSKISGRLLPYPGIWSTRSFIISTLSFHSFPCILFHYTKKVEKSFQLVVKDD